MISLPLSKYKSTVENDILPNVYDQKQHSITFDLQVYLSPQNTIVIITDTHQKDQALTLAPRCCLDKKSSSWRYTDVFPLKGLPAAVAAAVVERVRLVCRSVCCHADAFPLVCSTAAVSARYPRAHSLRH